MWIETGILFWFMESSLFSFSSSCSAFWIEVELALCGRWKTRDGARVPPGISRAKPLSSLQHHNWPTAVGPERFVRVSMARHYATNRRFRQRRRILDRNGGADGTRTRDL